LRLIDAIGCTVGGVEAPGNQALLDLVGSWGGASQATIISHGEGVPLQQERS